MIEPNLLVGLTINLEGNSSHNGQIHSNVITISIALIASLIALYHMKSNIKII